MHDDQWRRKQFISGGFAPEFFFLGGGCASSLIRPYDGPHKFLQCYFTLCLYCYVKDGSFLILTLSIAVLSLLVNKQSIYQSVHFHSGLNGATTARTTSWMMSEYDCLNKKRVNSRRKVDSELAATTSVGSVFQVCGAATAKARLPTVDSFTGGTTRRLAFVERSVRRPGKSSTRVSRPRFNLNPNPNLNLNLDNTNPKP